MTQRLFEALSRQRKYQSRHKRAGLCCHCSRPAARGTLFCELHRRKRNLRNREKLRKRFKRKTRYLKAESYSFALKLIAPAARHSRGAALMSVKAPIFSDLPIGDVSGSKK
jgi:hypothetical protein